MIRDETLAQIAIAVRRAINDAADDVDIGSAAIEAFIGSASLSDWDELEAYKKVP